MRLGVIGYLSKTGIGIMVDDFAEKLGAVAQLVIPHDTAEDLLPSTGRTLVRSQTWEPQQYSVDVFSKHVDVVVTVESDWGGKLFPRLRENGVKVVLLPMYEWWNPELPMNEHIDLFICTTKQCYEGVPFKNKVFIPCPIDTHKIKFRQRKGEVKEFVHNAGNIGIDGRKGTLEVVRAFTKTVNQEISLKINSQVPLTPEIIGLISTDPRITFFVKNHENYADLYKEGDVLLYTPHYDGQALVSAEAMAAGMAVMTIDAPPMNEHWEIYDLNYRDEFCLVPVKSTSNAQTINPRSLCYHVDEEELAGRIETSNYISLEAMSSLNRDIAQTAFSWDVCLPVYRHYLEMVHAL